MTQTASETARSRAALPTFTVDTARLAAAPVTREPFAFAIVPNFIREEALDGIGRDYPVISHPGSFPLPTLQFGPAFAQLMADIQSPEMTKIVGEKFNLDLSKNPTMVTVRGQSKEADGKIHTDSRTKIVTALIYMNDTWESAKGRLRLLRSRDNLNDVIAEVPPDRGTLLIFHNMPNAWHGFEPFAGPRRVIQLNWVTDESVVKREQARHRVSAFFKRLGASKGM